jgi:hypothetical protein
MLMIVGEYLQKINDDESSVEGLAFDVSLEIAKHEVSVSFESLISKDDEGVHLLDKLVSAEVLFDPSLCNSDLQTAKYNVKENKINFNKSCSAMLTKVQFEETLSYSDDVKLIHFGSFSFYSPVTGRSILAAAFGAKPKPILYFNPALTKEEISTIEDYKFDSILALSLCNIVQVNDAFLDEMYPNYDNKIEVMMKAHSRINVLHIKDGGISYVSSLESSDKIKVSKSFKFNFMKDDNERLYAIIAGAFLSSLHKNEVFGDELANPIYAPSSQNIETALDVVINELSSNY